MSWFPNLKISFKGDIFGGVKAGVQDAKQTWSDDEIHVADSTRNSLQKCFPPSAHIEEEGYTRALNHIRKGECGMAGDMIEAFKTPDSNELCVDVIKIAVVLICKGTPELLAKALPTTYY